MREPRASRTNRSRSEAPGVREEQTDDPKLVEDHPRAADPAADRERGLGLPKGTGRSIACWQGALTPQRTDAAGSTPSTAPVSSSVSLSRVVRSVSREITKIQSPRLLPSRSGERLTMRCTSFGCAAARPPAPPRSASRSVAAALVAAPRTPTPPLDPEHDLEAILACFDAEYRSEQPAHPNRGVSMFGTKDGRIISGRLHMEEVEQAGRDIETVGHLARRGQQDVVSPWRAARNRRSPR